MTYQDQQSAFDQHAHACYVEAASTLPPSMQGRLRAARRTALALPAGSRTGARRQRSWQLLPVGALGAALLAVAVGLRWQPGGESPGPAPAGMSAAQQSTDADAGSRRTGLRSATSDVAPMPAVRGQQESAATAQAADAALAGVGATDDEPLLMLEEDPDFYLWLGGDDALPVTAEPAHDPT